MNEAEQATLIGLLIALRDGDEDVRPFLSDYLQEMNLDPGLSKLDSVERIVTELHDSGKISGKTAGKVTPWLWRDATIQAIRAALKRRSGKDWSVKGGRGSDWGWLRITAPLRRRVRIHGDPFPEETAQVTLEDRTELAELLGFPGETDSPYRRVPDTPDYYREFIDRAEGRVPSVCGVWIWD